MGNHESAIGAKQPFGLGEWKRSIYPLSSSFYSCNRPYVFYRRQNFSAHVFPLDVEFTLPHEFYGKPLVVVK
mgnify:CR=1 FL=1